MMEITPEEVGQLYSDFSPTKKTKLMIRQNELLEKLSKRNILLEKQINLLEQSLERQKELLRSQNQIYYYLKKRLLPPAIKNPLNLEPGTLFSASDYYGHCEVTITGIVQKYSCGQWHEMYEYNSTCKSHDGMDTHVTFGQGGSVSYLTARYFLSIFSKEF